MYEIGDIIKPLSHNLSIKREKVMIMMIERKSRDDFST